MISPHEEKCFVKELEIILIKRSVISLNANPAIATAIKFDAGDIIINNMTNKIHLPIKNYNRIKFTGVLECLMHHYRSLQTPKVRTKRSNQKFY